MKKSVKRILCGALSTLMCSTLVAESVLRLSAEEELLGTTTSASVSYSEVKGLFDASTLREQYFNNSVLKSEDTAPTYETRTVMVTLSGDPLVDKRGNTAVTEYLGSWSGEVAKANIANEQSAFLQALTKKGIPYSVKRSYDTVLNAVAIEVNTKYVSEIKKMEGVDSVVITTAYAEPQTVDTTNHDVVTNETDVYETGIYDSSAFAAKYGEGTVVAVLDTGLDYTHAAFQGFKSENVNYAWNREYIKSVIENKHLVAETRSGSLDAADVYVSEKVPYAYDYADDDADVYPSYSNHGTHVAGIIGGYDPSGYTDKDGNPITDKQFLGVVPDAQLVICKVFTDDLDDPDLGGAVSEDIVAALEDCVTLGVDVINMSLGSSCGFTTTDDGDDEGEMLNAVYTRVMESGISLICAASNDYSAGYGGVYGTNLSTNPDSGTVGSPSTYAGALSVASINGQKASYLVANEESETNKAYVFFEEARDINSNPLDFVKGLTEAFPANNGSFEYVVVPGVGQAADYTSTVKRLFIDKSGNNLGRIALIKRGTTTFEEKVKLAMENGAAGVIVYNNVAGTIRMNLGEVENPIPSVSISMNAGAAMVAGAKSRVGKFTIDESFAAGPFMSEFSSWGPTHDLKLKPEITAHGGEITSAVPGGYGEQSGTSMATPNMAGFMAIVRSYIKKDLAGVVDVNDASAVNRLAMQLTMSTAGTVYDQENLPYSPRKQGAGVAKLENVVGGTKAYLWTDVARNDYRPKIELFDDPDRTGEYVLNFNVTNFGDSALSFKPNHEFMTETLSSDKLTVSEQAYMLNKSTAEWSVDGKSVAETDTITVEAGKTKKITVVLTLDEEDRNYIEESFDNGMYVEGFLKLTSATKGQCDLSLPFMGFYGDWDDAPMLDYSAYEVSENAQDASVLEEDKIKASVWETQPFSLYYNEKYILPMGEYLYLLPEDAEKMYVNEDYNSVSRYNEYYGEGADNNYLTSTGIKAVYAGLLRNARLVRYKLYDESTGEVILSDSIHRVGKAYSGGGSAVPANVEFELIPELEGMKANGKYKMTFEFFKDEPLDGETAREEDTFEFSFTLDYEAPVLEDARVRYYNYKENNKEKQRIYLDLDIYDNHYAQTVMLCYPKTGSDGELMLQLATDYPTPVRNPIKNGVTRVSLEITDIYEQYGDQLYLMIDDYSVNSCQYRINIDKANATVLPDDGFALGAGEENISVDIYGTHKTAVVFGENYVGDADPSNLVWKAVNPQIADVKNGEIVGLSQGTTKIFVSDNKGHSKTINVTVSDTVSEEMPKIPTLTFGVMQTSSGSLQKPVGGIEVNAGEVWTMTVETTPWYHPMTNLRLNWKSSTPSVATVDENGVVTTIKKGSATISATVQELRDGEWVDTLYSATARLLVQNEFTVSNYKLTKYNGLGYTVDEKLGLTAEDGVLVIPTDLNVMYIGEEAFKDNDNIKKIVIPESVVDIQARAFLNCTALEEVYFVSTKERDYDKEPAKADVSMIYEQAFEGCINLKKIDFSHVKTVTVAEDCFKGCVKLDTVIDMPSIGTMHHRAFAGTALTSVDLTGLHMSGTNVFADCTQLTKITTGRFTAIGDYMFSGCTGLKNEVQLHTPKIGAGAFSGCVNLSGVSLSSPKGYALEFDIGARAFENCGRNSRGSFYIDYGTEYIRSIGERAFAGSTLSELTPIYGLEILGENAFINTDVDTIYLTDTMDIENMRITGIPFGTLTVRVADSSQKYVEENGVIYNAGKSAILYVNASVSGAFTVENGVTSIGAYAFAGSNISSITLSASVNKLGVGAFKNATISSIDLSASAITEIPDNAFDGSALALIHLPNGVTNIGAYAFANSALASFKGDGVEHIGNNAFDSCKSLQEITLADGVKTMGDEVFANCNELVRVTLPSLEELGSRTFLGASKLEEVAFGANAAVTGTYTFVGTPVESVTLGKNVTAIGQGLFLNCKNITEITLPEKVTIVEAEAFASCSALTKVVGLENVEVFGYAAFYDVALEELNLAAAKEIGEMAFAVYADRAPTYTTLSIPNVEAIGSYAFFNGGESALELPASLKVVGEAAFASSDKLATVTVNAGNEVFFAEDGVLYRNVNEEKNRYELVSYPTARVEEGEKGARTYAVKEGTVRIQEYAFYAINKGNVDGVVLPYSVNAIGDGAFFESGILEYTFESIKAPALETVWRAEVQQAVESQTSSALYRGYYYTNFETYLLYYTSYGTQKSPLIMHYPANGVGYDNHIYTTYFGTRTPSEADLIEDGTRTYIQMIKEMPEASEIAAWAALAKTEENKAMVEAFAATMKTARLYYNNAVEKVGQIPFIEKEVEDKMFAIEKALRDVKAAFEIPFVVSELRVAEDSTHKKEYVEGERFEMEGLSLIVVYDDYSTETASVDKFQLLTTGELYDYRKYVEVGYEGTNIKVRVPITVVAENQGGDDSSSDSPSDSSSDSTVDSDSVVNATEGGCGCGSVIGFGDGQDAGTAALLVILLAVGCVTAVVRGKKHSDKE